MCPASYARHYDEHEEEFVPDELPEADDYPGREGPDEGPRRGTTPAWRDEHADHGRPRPGATTRCACARAAGASATRRLRRAGTPEQQEKWGGLTLAMAITEPGCGSDPSRVQTTAVLDEATDEWVLNGEKIFVTTGCRADGVVVWATLDKSAGRAGIKSFLVEKGTPGFIVAHKEKKLGIRADDTAALRVPGLPHPARATCSAATRRSRSRARAASAAS